jgi:hypothetical protein
MCHARLRGFSVGVLRAAERRAVSVTAVVTAHLGHGAATRAATRIPDDLDTAVVTPSKG